ncbi:hypothetical protein NPT69_002864 [Salmonella enterica subsp. enterica serovar Yaba]|nr:hypothetical protein [Salmonella enterica subsp. enterica serovar Yaba]
MITDNSPLQYGTDSKHVDDGCNHIDVILWRMNAGARARTRSAFVPAPKPEAFSAPSESVRPRAAAVIPAAKKKGKTHTGTAIRKDGEHAVKLHETATTWCASPHESYDKITGKRIGAPGRCRLVLSSITPIARKRK